MIITKKSQILAILGLILATNIAILLGKNYISGIFFLIFIPGLLIFKLFKFHKMEFWQSVFYIVSFSIGFIMLLGLFVNTFFPLIGIHQPLTKIPILISINLCMVLLIFYSKDNYEDFAFEIKKLNILSRILFLSAFAFPFLAAISAFSLNIGNPIYITLILLITICAFILVVCLSSNNIEENILPLSLFFISLSLLLMYSLRSWHISGWDIQTEYQVFQITKTLGLWSPLNFPGHPYNACLSITILPTIFSIFSSLSSEYIFKLVFVFIFAFVPVGIYYFFKKFTSSLISFIAVIFFISQARFISETTTVLRQAIAFIFFVLLLLIIFDKDNNKRKKNVLIILAGFCMIVSHYTTTYLALILFILVISMTIIIKYWKKFILRNNNNSAAWLSKTNSIGIDIKIILVLCVLTFLWYFVITHSGNNVIDFSKGVWNNIDRLSANEFSMGTPLEIFGHKKETLIANQYLLTYKNVTYNYYSNVTWVKPYPDSTNKNYEVKIAPYIQETKTNELFLNSITLATEIIKILSILFILGGTLYIIIHKKFYNIPLEYKLLAFISCIMLIVTVILPYVSTGYSVQRLYQQLLVILALPAVVGSLIIFDLFKSKLGMKLIVVFFIIYAACYIGLFSYFTGNPPLHVSNLGEAYYQYYTHEGEVASVLWLKEHYNEKSLIYADKLASLRLISFGYFNKRVINEVLPYSIDVNSYVYSSYSNTVEKRTFFQTKSDISISYNFPENFLLTHKNVIYNNKESIIYK